LLTLSLMIGTAGLPHVIIRFFTVPKVRDARASAGWALVFIAILYTTAPAVGSMARLNMINTVNGPDGQGTAYTALPSWFKRWENTGLLAWYDHNGDGKVQHAAGSAFKGKPSFVVNDDGSPKRGGYDERVTDNPSDGARKEGAPFANEIYVDRDIMVLANPEIAHLPFWVIALVAAGGLAAALSTAAGLLLAISSAISHDLLKGIFKPDISEKQELMAGRIAMAGAILVAGWLGMNPPGFAAQVVALAFGLAASSIFPALMMGIFYKKMNNTGAVFGMLAGLGSTLVYIFIYKGWLFIPGTATLPNTADNWVMGIQPESFGAVGALINFVVAIIVSKVTAAPPEHIQHLVEDIRVPKGAGAASSH
jgi:cation/acetate symporter